MLTVIGIVVLIVGTIQAYKTAKNSDRNAVVWALTTFGVGFGIQIILPFIIGIIMGIFFVASGITSPAQIQESIEVPATIIGIVCIILSIVAIFLILRYLSKIPEEKFVDQPPQPPSDFN